MILLAWDRSGDHAAGVALLFGTGLIGGTVLDALKRAVNHVTVTRLSWTWTGPALFEIAAIETAVQAALSERQDARLSVVWAAGQSGFGTDERGMQNELEAFRAVLDLARRLAAPLGQERRAFVHVSSAGGLFEGQAACDRTSVPAPLRPYGAGKLAQEALLRNATDLGRRCIVRPSSVYGYAPGARRGLVPTMIAAGLKGSEATIFGALTTQRDYIFAPDVGRFIAARVLDQGTWPVDGRVETALLASGRPATVFEILRLIETWLGSPLHIKVDPHPQNARDNTFLPSALPSGFHPTGLSEGVALTATAVSAERFRGAVL